jgi:hypothetical protein
MFKPVVDTAEHASHQNGGVPAFVYPAALK